MCTLTVVPTGAGYRAAFNRDERPDRPAGLPPAVAWVTGVAVAAPTDPHSGGTWLAVNDRGVTLALLNGNPPGPPRPGRVSRGRVIPALADAATPAAALERAAALPLAEFAPFRLVAVGGGAVGELWWGGDAADRTRANLTAPVLFTSSGLGDAVVAAPRAAFFAELLAAFGPPAAQDAFHRRRLPNREHLAVNMRRPGARTVGFAVIDVTADAVTFRYQAAAPDEPGADTVLELPLAAGVPA